MQNHENFSIAEDQIEELKKISSQLETISKDLTHIGNFVGENIHSIRKWIIFFGILTIINMVIGFVIGFFYTFGSIFQMM